MYQAQLNARCVKYFTILFTASSPPQLEVDGADGLIFTDADMEAFRVAAQGRLTERGDSDPGIRVLLWPFSMKLVLHGAPSGRLNEDCNAGWKRGTGLWVHLL